jgi:adenine-specific DNA-methyltransferase
MNYIGSKYSLLDAISRALDANGVSRSGLALDLFAGTGAVAQLLKLRGYKVYANDWQYYSYLTNVAFIELNTFPLFRTLLADSYWRDCIAAAPSNEVFSTYSIADRRPLRRDSTCAKVLGYLTKLAGKRGEFFDVYCEGGKSGRLYFSRENGLRIQAVRDLIEAWAAQRLITDKERAWLVACLLEAADRVANTASVYGAFLKHIKKSAQKPMTLLALAPIPSPHRSLVHRVFCEDAKKLLRQLRAKRFELVYVDPPYNRRQYNSNYHLLETIARWDVQQFEPRGLTGLRRSKERCSEYCIASRAEAAFRTLFERINSRYLLFSYNNEGLVARDRLEALFAEFCNEVAFEEITFKRFRADIDRENRVYRADSTREFLILGRLKGQAQLPLFDSNRSGR